MVIRQYKASENGAHIIRSITALEWAQLQKTLQYLNDKTSGSEDTDDLKDTVEQLVDIYNYIIKRMNQLGGDIGKLRDEISKIETGDGGCECGGIIVSDWDATTKEIDPSPYVTKEYDFDVDELSAIFSKNYYRQYINTVITTDSSKFDLDTLYTAIGEIEEDELKTININGTDYDDSTFNISIGNNSYLQIPRFIVKDHTLYLCNVTLIISANMDKTTITAGAVVIIIENGENKLNTNVLKVSSAKGMNLQDNAILKVSKLGSTINFTSSNGNHILGVVLKDGDEELIDSNILVYRVNEDTGDVGFTTPDKILGEYFTYSLYPKYYNGDYDEASDEVKTYTLLVIGIGKVMLTINCHYVVYEDYMAEQ